MNCNPGEGLKEKYIQTAARLFAKQASGAQTAKMSASFDSIEQLPKNNGKKRSKSQPK